MASLKALVEVFRLEANSFSKSFDKMRSSDERAEIVRQWSKAVKAHRAAQTLLDFTEQQRAKSVAALN
jgi:hypothetical protein